MSDHYSHRSETGFENGPFAGIPYTSEVTHFGDRRRDQIAYDCGCLEQTASVTRWVQGQPQDLLTYDPAWDKHVRCAQHQPKGTQ